MISRNLDIIEVLVRSLEITALFWGLLKWLNEMFRIRFEYVPQFYTRALLLAKLFGNEIISLGYKKVLSMLQELAKVDLVLFQVFVN